MLAFGCVMPRAPFRGIAGPKVLRAADPADTEGVSCGAARKGRAKGPIGLNRPANIGRPIVKSPVYPKVSVRQGGNFIAQYFELSCEPIIFRAG